MIYAHVLCVNTNTLSDSMYFLKSAFGERKSQENIQDTFYCFSTILEKVVTCHHKISRKSPVIKSNFALERCKSYLNILIITRVMGF